MDQPYDLFKKEADGRSVVPQGHLRKRTNKLDMDRHYDIFELLGEGPIWRASISGHEAAIVKMGELAKDSQNEFRLMHIPSNAVIAIVPAKKSSSEVR